MKHLVADVETYYSKDLSVTEQGLYNYSAEADAYLISVVADDFEFVGHPKEFARQYPGMLAAPDVQCWAYNANFDQAFAVKDLGPEVAERPWKCLGDRAATIQLPYTLAKTVKRRLGIDLNKEIRDEMRGVRFETLPPERQKQVAEYCLNDGRVELALLKSLPEPSAVEDEAAAHTRTMNRRGLYIDAERLARDVTRLEELKWDFQHEIPWVADESGDAPLSYPAFTRYCARLGIAPPPSLDKRSEDCNAWIKANPVGGAAVLAMRKLRTANAKLEKLKTLSKSLNDENRMPLEMRYCGARHTRRWSSQGYNVQNLDKKKLFVEEMTKKGWEDPGVDMRGFIIPPPGCVFGILDFSQIEPRCLNWAVGNTKLLDMMRQGFGIYEAYARSVGLWTAPEPLEVGDPALYHTTKGQVLGLGFGMGPGKYSAVSGVPIARAQNDVQEWRRLNPNITRLWRHFDEVIKRTAHDRTDLELELPTGDYLRHFNIRSTIDRETGRRAYKSFVIDGDFSSDSIEDNLWGGTLTENFVQRMARDVLTEAVLRVEKAGIPVMLHAHDEVVVALPRHNAPAALKEASHIMTIVPDWCPGLPVACKGGIAERYCKL